MFDAMIVRLDRAVRALLPEGERNDEHVVSRARFGGVVLVVLVISALVRGPMLLATGAPRQAGVLALCALVALLIPLVVRLTGSFRFAAHAIVALTLTPIVTVVHWSGGAGSPALLALVITPMLAVFLTGARSGLRWGIFTGGIIVAYAIADRLGASPGVLFEPSRWKLEKSLGAFALVMVMLALAIGYERSRSMAERRADAATARADERVAATERTHRASLDWLSEALAHEANNTLAYVMADLARLESRATADVARLGAERLRHLVRDVRIVAGGEQEQPADCAPVDLDRLVKEVVDEVAPLLGRLGVAIERRAAAGPVFASADAVALGRCIASALIASTPETSLGVTALDGERPAILITAPKGLVEQRPLTLKAVRLTIEALGGTMRTEATDTQATIRLELVGAEPPRAPATAVVPAAEATALRVLIVDDEPLILRTAKRLLSRFDVTTTTSPVEALELVQKERFDVFVCDFSMPEMRGDAVFASAVDRGFDPKHFVLMTGGSTVPIERAFGSRRPILLEKPYTRGELEGAIGRAVASAG